MRDLDPAVHAIVGRAEHLAGGCGPASRVWMALGSRLLVAALAGTACGRGAAGYHPGARVAPRAAQPGEDKAARTRHASPKPQIAAPPRGLLISYPAGGFAQWPRAIR